MRSILSSIKSNNQTIVRSIKSSSSSITKTATTLASSTTRHISSSATTKPLSSSSTVNSNSISPIIFSTTKRHFSFVHPNRKLSDIVKLHLLLKQTPDRIAQIWHQHHSYQPAATATTITKKQYETIMRNSKSCPFFIFPTPKITDLTYDVTPPLPDIDPAALMHKQEENQRKLQEQKHKEATQTTTISPEDQQKQQEEQAQREAEENDMFFNVSNQHKVKTSAIMKKASSMAYSPSSGFFILLSQFQDKSCFLTSLDDYRRNPASAEPYFVLSMFDELLTRGAPDLVLVRVDIMNAHLNRDLSDRLLNAIIRYYSNDNDFVAIERFNHRPREFDHNKYIAELLKNIWT